MTVPWYASILWHSIGVVLLVTFTAWVAAICAGDPEPTTQEVSP